MPSTIRMTLAERYELSKIPVSTAQVTVWRKKVTKPVVHELRKRGVVQVNHDGSLHVPDQD